MIPAPEILLALLAWGVVVGLDLVSVPQSLVSRPLVAGAVAGWLLGDVAAGLRVGATLELFALDVLPFGGVRYPEYGPAAIGATALAAGAPWQFSLGPAVVLGLAVAVLGGHSIYWVRRANARAVQVHTAALQAGQTTAIRRLQWGGLGRDALRALAMTAVALTGGLAAAQWLRLEARTALALGLVVVAGGLAATLTGALRSAGRGSRLRWLGLGLAVGTCWLVLR